MFFRMVNIKVTARKEVAGVDTNDELRCAMCSKMLATDEEWKEHTLDCAKQRRVKKFKCKDCNYATNKSCDMKRHTNRMHTQGAADSDDEWKAQDPGEMTDILGAASETEEISGQSDTEGEVINEPQKTEKSATSVMSPPVSGNLELGRIIRKPTAPSIMSTGIKRKLTLSPKKIDEIKRRIVLSKPKIPSKKTPAVKCGVPIGKQKDTKDSIEVGVSAVSTSDYRGGNDSDKLGGNCTLCEKSRNEGRLVRRTKKTTRTYQEGGQTIVEVVEEEYLFG